MTETDKIDKIEYPVAALGNVVFALLTAVRRIIAEDEGATLHGKTVEELLLNVASWHPEPDVANWVKYEIAGLFAEERREEK